ncbi:MAG: ATP-binding cassette domain-containing protein [Salinarimonadaceae bacterium]|nr:MAG: ATP-binding cassette domain-containing protein [Salinarimonadaceae bacterium]
MAPLLEASDVHVSYPVGGMFSGRRAVKAVNGVSLQIERGSVLGIVGESGCGKSTLSRLLIGLEQPTSGSVWVDGAPIAQMTRLARARRIQPVFQDPYSSLNPRRSIEATIRQPLDVHGIGTSRERIAAVREMMDLVGLAQRHANSYPSQLSGGQRQRVAIARALVIRPELLVCDEPTSALDVSVQSQILNLLQDLRAEFNLTYVLISHDLAIVEHIATRVAVMYTGKIVEEGETSAVFSNPLHPYSRALLSAVLTPEPGLGIPETRLRGSFPNPMDLPPGCTFHPRCPESMPICMENAPCLQNIDGKSVSCHLYAEQRSSVESPRKQLG